MHLQPVQSILERARGRAEVAVSQRAGRIRLDRLLQEGCAKALLPRTHGPVPEVVLVNTSGGIAGGDHLDWRLAVGADAALVATTQAAERIYRSSGSAGRVTTHLELGDRARLDWLPQETILFEAARLERRLEVEMAEDAALVALETVVLGRSAMGETVASGLISDHWRIRRGDRLVHAEALRAEGDLVAATRGPATLAGGRALATLVAVEPGADDRLATARALLADTPGVEAAASAKPGLLIVRFLAGDARPLHDTLIRFLMAYRSQPLPRVWST
jgi:urease accessory protein